MTNREALAAMTNWELALWITERIQTAFYWGETPDADAEYKWLNEEAEFCDRHECRAQKEEMTGERCANCLYFEQAESEMRGRCMYKYPPAFVLPEEWCRRYVPINEEAGE